MNNKEFKYYTFLSMVSAITLITEIVINKNNLSKTHFPCMVVSYNHLSDRVTIKNIYTNQIQEIGLEAIKKDHILLSSISPAEILNIGRLIEAKQGKRRLIWLAKFYGDKEK